MARVRMTWAWVEEYPIFTYTRFIDHGVFHVKVVKGRNKDQNSGDNGPNAPAFFEYISTGIASVEDVGKESRKRAKEAIKKEKVMKLEIDKRWKWAVKYDDCFGKWGFFTSKPRLDGAHWSNEKDHSSDTIRNIFSFPECASKDSLHQIVNGELVKYVDLKVDDKVMVRDGEGESWKRRHFSHFGNDGILFAFAHGLTSWSEKGTISWKEWRLPTAEELKG